MIPPTQFSCPFTGLPFVSILIPTYARVAWLEEALYCAVHQDYGGCLEILVCNDCPRQTLVCNDPLVKIINVPPCGTYGSKRNHMVSAAAGDYLVWLDDDDLALPWYVDRLEHDHFRMKRSLH